MSFTQVSIREGAIAEICSFLADLNPIPSPRPIKVTRMGVTTSRTLRLARADLTALRVDLEHYGARDYNRTQQIGAALAFLGLDGLIAPSARWPSDNLIIFIENHASTERLEPVGEEQIDWHAWARGHGMLPEGK